MSMAVAQRPGKCGPPVAYAGGKRRLAGWITSHLPRAGVTRYVETCVGGGSILCAVTPRYPEEVINDLDAGISSFWRAVRDHQEALCRAVTLTPFSRTEWRRARDQVRRDGYPDDVVEAARLFLIVCQQSYGRVNRPSSGWRLQRAAAGGGWVAREWDRLPDAIAAVAERLHGVVVDQRDVVDLVPMHDSPTTLFYVDPPYHPETCAVAQCYREWMDRAHHGRLAEVLNAARAMVVLSGYRCADYDRWYSDWRRVDRTFTSGLTAGLGTEGRPQRVESLWLNAACAAALGGGQMALFGEEVGP